MTDASQPALLPGVNPAEAPPAAPKPVARIAGGFRLVPCRLFGSPVWLNGTVWLKALLPWLMARADDKGHVETTIEAIRDALGYRAGGRWIRPTRDQVRGAYETLGENATITTANTTRGLAITLVGFQTYQNPANYEPHSENVPNPTVKPTRKRPRKPAEPRPRHPVHEERDALWEAVKAAIGFDPQTENERSRMGQLVNVLKAHNATPADVPRYAAEYRRLKTFKDCVLTPEALAKHWETLGASLAKRPPSQDALAARDAAQVQQEAEVRRQQQEALRQREAQESAYFAGLSPDRQEAYRQTVNHRLVKSPELVDRLAAAAAWKDRPAQ